jgi:hypothetical protein
MAINRITTQSISDGTITAAKVASDMATQAELDTKLNLSGGAMTGAITTNSTFDGIDIATRDAVLTSTTTTAGAALPKAGGTMTGTITSTHTTALQLTNNTTSKIHFGDSGNASIGKIEYVHSSNHLAFKVNDAERMRIDSSGNVAFAASATGGANIIGVSGDQTDRNTGGYPQYTFVGNQGTGMRRPASNQLAFDTSGDEAMRINSSGSVGIGTTNIHDRLHVVGNLYLEDGSPEITFETTGSAHANWQLAAQEHVSNAFEISSGSQDSDASNDTFTPRLTILNNGNATFSGTVSATATATLLIINSAGTTVKTINGIG